MRTMGYLIFVAILLTACSFPTTPAQALQNEQALAAAQLPEVTPTPLPSFDELLARAQDAANLADWGAAITYLDLAAHMQPDTAQLYRQRGLAYQAAGDLEAALADFNQAIALEPSQAASYLHRSWVLVQQNDVATALADINQAIALAPTYAQAYRNRAALQTSLGNYTAASFDLQVYLSLVPAAADAAAVQAEMASLQAQANAQAGDAGLLFIDDFSDPASGWYSNGGPSTQAEYVQGGYVLGQADPNAVVWALPARLVTDTRIQVTATRIGGVDDNFFGLLCRVQGTGQTGDFYAFLISSDGHFGIAKKRDNSLGLLGQEMMMRHPAILQGDGPNVITAICAGSRLALYVNGELVAETSDEEYTVGQVGLIVGTFNEGGTQLLFDDFSVYREP